MIFCFLSALLILPAGGKAVAVSAEGRSPRSRSRSNKDYERQMLEMRRKLREKERKAREERSLKMVEELERSGFRARTGPPICLKERKRMVKMLRSPLPEERAEAAWWIGVNMVKESVPGLVRLLKDRDEHVRSNAVFALGRLDARHMGPRFFVLLERDDSQEVRGRAAEALGRFNYSRAVPLLLKALKSRDARVKMGALEGLSRMGGAVEREAVLSFSRDEDPLIRMKVAEALGRMDREHAKVELMRFLDDEDEGVITAAVKSAQDLAFSEAIPRIRELLKIRNKEILIAAIAALVILDAVDSLEDLQKLQSVQKGTDELVGADAAYAVARLGGELSIEGLARLLRSEDNRVLIRAVRAAGKGGARWAEPILVTHGKHDLSSIREEVALALGRIEAYESIPVLMELMKDSVDEVRAAAVKALGRLGGPRTLHACVLLLRDSHPEVAGAAAQCIAMLADPEWELAQVTSRNLAGMLRLDADPAVAGAVADALGAVGVKGNRTGFIRLMRLTLHRDAGCRANAARALGRLEKGTWRQSESAIKRMLERDQSMEVRSAAAVASARMGFRDVYPVVEDLFRKWKDNTRLRAEIALALAVYEEKWISTAEKLFLEFVNTRPNTLEKRELTRLLGEFQVPWAKDLLLKAESSPNAMVRAEARRLLGKKPPVPGVRVAVLKPDASEVKKGANKVVEDRKTEGKIPTARRDRRKSEEEYSGPFPVNRTPEEQTCLGCGCRFQSQVADDFGRDFSLRLLFFCLIVLLKRSRPRVFSVNKGRLSRNRQAGYNREI